jgi:replication factor C subunit 2/4
VETIERLKVIAEDGNMPHIIISVSAVRYPTGFELSNMPFLDMQGMPGIGKTTSIHCLAHALLGDAYKEGVLELNASDER